MVRVGAAEPEEEPEVAVATSIAIIARGLSALSRALRRTAEEEPTAAAEAEVEESSTVLTAPAEEAASTAEEAVPEETFVSPRVERPVQRLPVTREYGQELRYYAVWVVPNHPELCGVHWGIKGEAYHSLVERANGFGGIRWKRVSTLSEAKRLFAAEASRRRVSAEFAERIFGWVPVP